MSVLHDQVETVDSRILLFRACLTPDSLVTGDLLVLCRQIHGQVQGLLLLMIGVAQVSRLGRHAGLEDAWMRQIGVWRANEVETVDDVVVRRGGARRRHSLLLGGRHVARRLQLLELRAQLL